MRITFLEFKKIVRGFQFFNKNNKQVFNYQLYWNRINPEDLIAGKTKFRAEIRL